MSCSSRFQLLRVCGPLLVLSVFVQLHVSFVLIFAPNIRYVSSVFVSNRAPNFGDEIKSALDV